MSSTLSEKLRRHRKEKKLTLDALAARSGTSKSYLWELENTSERRPSGALLTRVAQALGVTTDYLLSDDEEPGSDAQKDSLFRRFRALSPSDQEKIHQLIDLWTPAP